MEIIDEDCVRLACAEKFPDDPIRNGYGVDWQKRPPRLRKAFFNGLLKPITIQTGWQTAEVQWLDRFHDVHLTWSNFFIKDDCCVSIYADAETAVSGIVGWPELSETSGISRRGSDFVVRRSRLQNAEHISGRIMFASSNEPHNWGMWLLYVLPAVRYFIENRHLYDRLLVYADRPNMQAMLRLLGLKDADMICHDCSKAYHFDSIDVFRQKRREFYVAQEARTMFADLRDKVMGSATEPSPSHIYINRNRRSTGNNIYRRLMNEREFEQRLIMMGYSSIDPEDTSPEKQIELFGSARKIVVLGGAGLFNAVFCKPGTKIIDIESTCNHIENHSTILSSMDLDYGIILGQEDQNDPALYDKQWTVDVERTIAAIAKFMS